MTVLMLHGNAGSIHMRLPIAKNLADGMGVKVLLLEYRGYGLSNGEPDETGLNRDAQAGLDWLRNHNETRHTSFVIYGQSLGGAVALSLCNRNQSAGDIAGLILENTFLSMRKLIPRYDFCLFEISFFANRTAVSYHGSDRSCLSATSFGQAKK